jgi:8-oxo-dGTP diphosphatase
MKPDYDKVGLLAIRDGRILLCRKKHTTSLLILPGGCFEPGETAGECLNRELREELGDVQIDIAEYVGTYTDTAAGSSSKTVRIELFRAELIGDPAPHSEIKELVWFGERDNRAQLAPSLVNKILPDLIARGILDWG